MAGSCARNSGGKRWNEGSWSLRLLGIETADAKERAATAGAEALHACRGCLRRTGGVWAGGNWRLPCHASVIRLEQQKLPGLCGLLALFGMPKAVIAHLVQAF